MGSIKDRNGIDLTDAEDMKKRWQEYTGELYKKHLHVHLPFLNLLIQEIILKTVYRSFEGALK